MSFRIAFEENCLKEIEVHARTLNIEKDVGKFDNRNETEQEKRVFQKKIKVQTSLLRYF